MTMREKDQEFEVNKALWANISEHVSRGEEATGLLTRLFYEIGPYRQDKPSDKTWAEVQRFVGFDDSV